jgi:hypothetical protein
MIEKGGRNPKMPSTDLAKKLADTTNFSPTPKMCVTGVRPISDIVMCSDIGYCHVFGIARHRDFADDGRLRTHDKRRIFA